LERDDDFLVWRDLRRDSISDGNGPKVLGGRVNHQRFDFFPHVEFMGAIAPINVLHREIREGGVEGQLDGVGKPWTQVR